MNAHSLVSDWVWNAMLALEPVFGWCLCAVNDFAAANVPVVSM